MATNGLVRNKRTNLVGDRWKCFLEEEKEMFAVKIIQGIDIVMIRRVQAYKLLRDQNNNLLRNLKKGNFGK